MRSVQTFGKTREEAIEKAAAELGVRREDLIIEVLEEGSKGFLGFIGSKDFKIRASVKESLKEDFSPKDVLMGIEEEEPQSKQTEKIKREEILSESGEEAHETKERSKENKISLSLLEIKESVNGFLDGIFGALDIEAETSVRIEGDVVKVLITGESAGILIGRRGESLDALQMLLGLSVNKTAEGYVKLQLDIENYREKREESLIRYAKKMARMASKQRRNICLEPMSPNERRIVHSALQSDSYVTTYSEGDEPYRKVVIAVKGRYQH
ncbi:MAG: RNA-binding cell elongation regulator Jag/EloR [Peptostreptococcaceae bacterium]|nr:RNA-binding cell elongation regulator Jag/EloR [Peptostreptococcaceae bacterium]